MERVRGTGKEVYIIDDDFLIYPQRVSTFISITRTENKQTVLTRRADFIEIILKL
jgi:hypothetical protein